MFFSHLCISPITAQERKGDNGSGTADISGEVYNPDGIELIYVAGTGNGVADIHDFYIGKYEVTQTQWQTIMGYNPSKFKGDNLPVEMVSWEEAQAFISRLNARTGRNYRLPAEIEWEYAARGGSKKRNYEYSGSNKIYDVAWFSKNSAKRTHTVGTKQPNELGIYDMSGNVAEWCLDLCYTNKRLRVLRGGSWRSIELYCRVSHNYSGNPKMRNAYSGFRIVLPVEYTGTNVAGDANSRQFVTTDNHQGIQQVQQVQQNNVISAGNNSPVIREPGAYDVITLRNGNQIKAKNTEVNIDNVRYINFDNPDGPVYTIRKSDIVTILYQNGMVDTFVK